MFEPTHTPDSFPRTARWDSVGISCSMCSHFGAPKSWPDTARTSFCQLHRRSLAIELAVSGYMEGEWFCSDFSPTERANSDAVAHFATVSAQLPSGHLLRFTRPGEPLSGIPFSALPASHGGAVAV